MRPSTEFMNVHTPPPQIYDVNALVELLDRHYPRVLTQIDRDPHSPTYGSCDRHLWMYRLHDFDSGVLQQASLTFAALYALADVADFSSCRYLDSAYQPYWRALAEAINRRTAKLLGPSGMLDEYYPGERSFPATVFACYAALKSAMMLEQKEIIESSGLEAAARMLLRHSPSPAANQDVAGAVFLSLYAQIQDWHISEVKAKVERLLARAEHSGDFLEYGGTDLGYASVTLNYLAYMQADGSHPTLEILKKLANFISVFITPRGLVGGEFASRSTTYLLPFGLIEAAYSDALLARRFASVDLRASFEKLDDRYLMHYCMPSLAMAALKLSRLGPPVLGTLAETESWVCESYRSTHIFAFRRNKTVVFIGVNKGGAFHIEDQGKTYTDCGYRLERGGEVYATCVLDESPEVWVREDDCKVEVHIRTPFRRYGTLIASSFKTVILRLLRFLGPTFNSYFKSILIKKPQILKGAFLNRCLQIDFKGNALIIDDIIEGIEGRDYLTASPASSLRLVPSAKLFQAGEEEAFLRAIHSQPPGTSHRRVITLCNSPKTEAQTEGHKQRIGEAIPFTPSYISGENG